MKKGSYADAFNKRFKENVLKDEQNFLSTNRQLITENTQKKLKNNRILGVTAPKSESTWGSLFKRISISATATMDPDRTAIFSKVSRQESLGQFIGSDNHYRENEKDSNHTNSSNFFYLKKRSLFGVFIQGGLE